MTRHTLLTISQILMSLGTLGFVFELLRQKVMRERKEREQ